VLVERLLNFQHQSHHIAFKQTSVQGLEVTIDVDGQGYNDGDGDPPNFPPKTLALRKASEAALGREALQPRRGRR